MLKMYHYLCFSLFVLPRSISPRIGLFVRERAMGSVRSPLAHRWRVADVRPSASRRRHERAADRPCDRSGTGEGRSSTMSRLAGWLPPACCDR